MMIRYCLLLVFLSSLCISAEAQSTVGLFRYFSFNNCDGTDDIGSGQNALLIGSPECNCGVEGNALQFDGLNDAVLILGAESILNTVDFSLSLYYKSTSGGIQDLVSNLPSPGASPLCDNNNAFSISVSPGGNSIITQFQENIGKGILFNNQLDLSNCWHHVVFVRDGDVHRLFLDGVLVEESSTVTRVDISRQDAIFSISSANCPNVLPFKGFIDEVRLYTRALSNAEIDELAVPIDQILTTDTLIFLGNTVDISTSSSCANSFGWSPTVGVDIPSDPNASITPLETTTYSLQFSQESCVATDSIRISVIDPELLDCNELFMANAFTPNNDGNNDTYGISNPFAIEDFISIEILDRFGGRLFFSDDAFGQWDGNFQGVLANPGVYLYRVFFECDGMEQVRTGSVTLIR